MLNVRLTRTDFPMTKSELYAGVLTSLQCLIYACRFKHVYGLYVFEWIYKRWWHMDVDPKKTCIQNTGYKISGMSQENIFLNTFISLTITEKEKKKEFYANFIKTIIIKKDIYLINKILSPHGIILATPILKLVKQWLRYNKNNN